MDASALAVGHGQRLERIRQLDLPAGPALGRVSTSGLRPGPSQLTPLLVRAASRPPLVWRTRRNPGAIEVGATLFSRPARTGVRERARSCRFPRHWFVEKVAAADAGWLSHPRLALTGLKVV